MPARNNASHSAYLDALPNVRSLDLRSLHNSLSSRDWNVTFQPRLAPYVLKEYFPHYWFMKDKCIRNACISTGRKGMYWSSVKNTFFIKYFLELTVPLSIHVLHFLLFLSAVFFPQQLERRNEQQSGNWDQLTTAQLWTHVEPLWSL